MVYKYYHVEMVERLDQALLTRAENIAASIDTYWEVQRMELNRDGGKILHTKINNLEFLKLVEKWMEENRSDDVELMNFLIQLFDHNGKVLRASRYLTNTVPLSEEAIKNTQNGIRHYGYLEIEADEDNSLEFRTLTIPVYEGKKIAYYVQIATSMSPVESALTGLRVILLTLFPLTVILASASTSIFMANLILRPLHNIISTVKKISASNLDMRVEIPKTRDEMADLSVTFNNMLEKLQKSFQTERQFLQDCSHELRTPLTILHGEIEVLLKQDRRPEEYRQVLESNLEEIKKITSLVENLLILSRMDGHGLVEDFSPKSLGPLIHKILETMLFIAEAKKIHLTWSLPPEEIVAQLLPEKFQRALINIVDNAIKYTLPEGKVQVNLKKEGNQAVISVVDNGVGIEEQNLPRVFDRFFRENRAHCDGHGLGLSIARSIVKAHGG
ncbi:MAG: ATP-binding protein, partial [Pseudomonadota bacterium]